MIVEVTVREDLSATIVDFETVEGDVLNGTVVVSSLSSVDSGVNVVVSIVICDEGRNEALPVDNEVKKSTVVCSSEKSSVEISVKNGT